MKIVNTEFGGFYKFFSDQEKMRKKKTWNYCFFTDESTPLSKFLYEYYDNFSAISLKLNTRLPLKLMSF